MVDIKKVGDLLTDINIVSLPQSDQFDCHLFVKSIIEYADKHRPQQWKRLFSEGKEVEKLCKIQKRLAEEIAIPLPKEFVKHLSRGILKALVILAEPEGMTAPFTKEQNFCFIVCSILVKFFDDKFKHKYNINDNVRVKKIGSDIVNGHKKAELQGIIFWNGTQDDDGESKAETKMIDAQVELESKEDDQEIICEKKFLIGNKPLDYNLQKAKDEQETLQSMVKESEIALKNLKAKLNEAEKKTMQYQHLFDEEMKREQIKSLLEITSEEEGMNPDDLATELISLDTHLHGYMKAANISTSTVNLLQIFIDIEEKLRNGLSLLPDVHCGLSDSQKMPAPADVNERSGIESENDQHFENPMSVNDTMQFYGPDESDCSLFEEVTSSEGVSSGVVNHIDGAPTDSSLPMEVDTTPEAIKVPDTVTVAARKPKATVRAVDVILKGFNKSGI